MGYLEPRQVFICSARLKEGAYIVTFFLMVMISDCLGQQLSGAWISPDWFLPGSRSYAEEDVRRASQQELSRLKGQGIDTVFLETFLRGTSICPTIYEGEGSPQVVAYRPDTDSTPVYPHLSWKYRQDLGVVQDPLSIFIEEAGLAGIEVHAWVHMFYWRMDNSDIMLPWHNGPTLWAELMESYLRSQSKLIKLRMDQPKLGDDKQKVPAIRPEVIDKAAEVFHRSCDVVKLEKILQEAGISAQGHPFNALVLAILAAGGERPDFLLTSPSGDPFPAARGKILRPIYVNPEHPEVVRRLRYIIKNIAETHPGLAGIHLDHIRYPVDGQGLSREAGVFDGSYRVYSPSDEEQLEQYRVLNKSLELRRSTLFQIVSLVRQDLPRRMQLSAAVLPLYYRDRDQGKFLTSGYDYSAQAWLDWPVDFVVPMLYEYHPYLIRSLTKSYQGLATAEKPSRPIRVYPGISRLEYVRKRLVDADQGWVYFDLSLSRDVNLRAREREDLDFGG